jgi:2-polyprenyl-3-methyl-5-hydroxy-6-metoxy-1,4-benzoquinol methylase
MIEQANCPACGSKDIFSVFSAKDYTVSLELFEIWECKNCTLRFTGNPPDKMEIAKYYQSENYISHSDTSKGFINNLYHKVRKRTLVTKKNLVEKTTKKSAGSILDVGCGTGAFLHTMKTAGWQVTGLEPDSAARQKASELHNIQPENSQVFFSLPVQSFDAITMWHVLEHVHDLHPYLDQLRKLIIPSGKIFIAVPNYTSYDAKYYREFWAAYDVPRHLYHFSPTSMKKLFASHGLKLIQTRPMWYDSIYVSMLSEKYENGQPNAIRAAMVGGLSNIKALAKREKCSSLIYIGENQ